MISFDISFYVSLILVITITRSSTSESKLPVDKVPATLAGKTFYVNTYIPKRDRARTPELIQRYGHQYEEFDVTTEDGYILKLFHIVGSNSTDPPILLQHGLLDSSETFLIRGKNSLAINLTESGYDVWLANFRGNRYSRRHVIYNPDTDKVFWDFTFHENGYFDLPALIDFVLKKTGKPQMILVGHSQGTLDTFVMGTARPEYNDKIKVFIALAPICFTKHWRGLSAVAQPAFPLLYTAFTAAGEVELLNQNSTLRRFIQDLCTENSEIGYELCGKGIFLAAFGPDAEQFEPDFLPVVIGHYLAGTSVKLIAHGAQLYEKFGWFDYGPSINLVKYGSPIAPLYDLSKFTSKVVLMVGKNDYAGDVLDSKALSAVLPNATYFEMPREKFNHLDFVWGKDMKEIFFPYFHNFLNEYK